MLRSLHSYSRWQAFGIHLSISLVILLTILSLVFFLWYPSPFYHVIDIWVLLAVLIVVDVIIGPLLTLVVFKPGKKGLALDLSIIAALQLAALSYGTFKIYQNRPFFQVFTVDRFKVVSIQDVDMAQLPDPAMAAGFHFGPRLIYADAPTDAESIQKILMEIFSGGPDVDRRPEYYRPYGGHVAQVLARARPLDALKDKPAGEEKIQAFLADQGGEADDYRFLPLTGGANDVAQVIAADTARPVGAIYIDPW